MILRVVLWSILDTTEVRCYDITLRLPVDQLIKNLYKYFTKEKSNLGPLIPVTQVRAWVVDALKISESILKRVLQWTHEKDVQRAISEDDEVSKNEQDVQQVVCVNERAKLKTTDLPESIKCTVRDVIYDMYFCKQHVTLNTLLMESCRYKLFKFAAATLQDNNRHALCEKPTVVQQRRIGDTPKNRRGFYKAKMCKGIYEKYDTVADGRRNLLQMGERALQEDWERKQEEHEWKHERHE
ncbi:hypothetical protein ILUMI_27132 [Ignelater luminosus]|uniref:Uncharacterized protein n=1 Tax=Ignelater luminosus TaxID=2038154 RepID=A0A8K0C3Q7_IGNLU|nr:hypothetical protein ILUMI_27132 [Ignelater luminosus]